MAGKGKVLLVDDEEIILDVSREVLRFLGTTLLLSERGRLQLSCTHRKKRRACRLISSLLTLLSPREWGAGRQ